MEGRTVRERDYNWREYPCTTMFAHLLLATGLFAGLVHGHWAIDYLCLGLGGCLVFDVGDVMLYLQRRKETEGGR